MDMEIVDSPTGGVSNHIEIGIGIEIEIEKKGPRAVHGSGSLTRPGQGNESARAAVVPIPISIAISIPNPSMPGYTALLREYTMRLPCFSMPSSIALASGTGYDKLLNFPGP